MEGRINLEKTPVKNQFLDDGLLSFEKLGASPDLCPDENFMRHQMNQTPVNASPPAWTRGLSQDDINAMYQLGALSTNGMISEIKKLHDQAFQLGIAEAKEMTRAKHLGNFNIKKKKK